MKQVGKKLSHGCGFCRFICSLGILFLAGVSLAQADTTAGPTALDPAAPGSTGASAVEGAESCTAEQACVDRYLWSLYERTPKIDTATVPEQTKVTVKRKGKTRTVTKTTTKLV